jgi:hypothetical protein
MIFDKRVRILRSIIFEKKKLIIFTASSSLNSAISYLLSRVTGTLNVRNLYKNWKRVFSTFDLFISSLIIKIIASNRSSTVKIFFFNFLNPDLPRFLFLILNLIFCPSSGSEIFWISTSISASRSLSLIWFIFSSDVDFEKNTLIRRTEFNSKTKSYS